MRGYDKRAAIELRSEFYKKRHQMSEIANLLALPDVDPEFDVPAGDIPEETLVIDDGLREKILAADGLFQNIRYFGLRPGKLQGFDMRDPKVVPNYREVPQEYISQVVNYGATLIVRFNFQRQYVPETNRPGKASEPVPEDPPQPLLDYLPQWPSVDSVRQPES